MFDAFKKLCEEWVKSAEISYFPSEFKQVLGKRNKDFADDGQHDAQECLNTLIDALGKDTNISGTSRIKELFYGSQTSINRCPVNGFTSEDLVAIFNMLHLSFFGSSALTLQNMFDKCLA
ncbi:MAG: ubiquitin carboxyl-terminal hydrolase [Streptococcaceae bacterium]|nr:ubiquitin carboxyl-terminal hydrolase [Streptococcaceae bacterium]